MDRRDFLKCGAAAIAAAALPVAAVELNPPAPLLLGSFPVRPGSRESTETNRWSEFDPEMYYGNGIALTYQPANLDVEEKFLDTLYDDMCRFVPPNYRSQVVLHGKRSDFNSGMQLAWKYYPA